MLFRQVTLLRLAVLGTEVSIAILSVALASILRFGPAQGHDWSAASVPLPLFAGSYAVAWAAAVWLSDLHRLRARWTFRVELADLARALVLLQLILFAILFAVRLPDVSRLFLIELFVVHAILATGSRTALRILVAWLPVRGRGWRHVLVAGAGADALAFAGQLQRHPELGLRITGHLLGSDGFAAGSGAKVVGMLEDALEVFHEQVVDELLVALDGRDIEYVDPLVRLAQEEGKVVRILVGDGPPPSIPGGRLEVLDGTRVLSVLPTNERTLGLLVKRLLDMLVALAAIALLSPAFLAITLAIVLTDGRPVLFRQVRVGLHGRTFRVFKFRTMVKDAEARLVELEAINEIRGQAFKVTNDPRVTRVGRLLRRTSLDELPQFWNVLRGEMSIVGPRPPLPGEVAQYGSWHRRRLSMRPGITGLWQISARQEPDFERWVQFDLVYIERWSVWLDLKIMARTIPAMLQGR
jgi:exopolysaccharide biosynthesis polyprenyl glycosylphosphotransferase